MNIKHSALWRSSLQALLFRPLPNITMCVDMVTMAPGPFAERTTGCQRRTMPARTTPWEAPSAPASPEASIAGYGLLQSMRILIENGAAAGVGEAIRRVSLRKSRTAAAS